MSNTKIGVRELAEYAADPKSFRANRGRTINKSAAKAGIQAHNELGRGYNVPWRSILFLLIIGLVIYVGY